MDKVTLAVIGLRASALALTLSGQVKAANSLYALADLVEAGRASDAHMELVAEKLKTRDITDADWDDVISRIETDSDRLQGS